LCFIFCIYSSKDPFEKHIIGNLTDYFKGSLNITDISINRNNNLVYSENNFNIYINNKHKKLLSKNNSNVFLRKLISEVFCDEIHNDFIKYKGKKLSNIFDFNFKPVFIYSIIYLGLSIILIAIVIYFLKFEQKTYDIGKSLLYYALMYFYL